jgi:iodotyrosine deiodinase
MTNKKFSEPKFIPLEFEKIEPGEQIRRAEEFYELMRRRRTVREFSDRDVPFEIVERAIATAGTAPSGANLQPWRFVVVRDAEIKRQIRVAAEREEYESYHGRMSEKWLRRLAILGTDEHKPFLEIAPYLIVVFRLNTITDDAGETEPTYYSQESVGIAVGMLLAALPDEIFTGNSRKTEKRNSVRADSGRLSGGERESAGHRAQTARRDFVAFLN